jgi:hypothetical protein
MSEESRDIHYTESLELVLKKSAEEFQCLRKTHDDSQRWTASYNTVLSIPVIILSGLAGLGAVGSDNLLPFSGSQTLVGMVSFLCATLQTIASYFNFSKRSEAHRQVSIQYARLYQLVSLELSLPRNERLPADKLISMVKEEAGRLLETAPQIPQSVVEKFKKQFHGETRISIPSILNGLEEVRVVSLSTAPLTPAPQPQTPTPRPLVRLQV